MKHIASYANIFQLGHKAIEGLLAGIVLVEEKVDGSQFSFMKDEEGNLSFRSKGADIHVDPATNRVSEKMFSLAVASVQEIAELLTPNWVYRGEYLRTPKHNALEYGRVPQRNIVLFDISDGLESYLSPEKKRVEAERIGLEVVPVLYQGVVDSKDSFQQLLLHESFLGGPKIEGVVVKRYDLFTADKHVAMGKYVSEEFKEVHRKAWKVSNPAGGDVVQRLVAELATEARWQKAVQHLKERGLLESSPRDIGLLVQEVPSDVFKEEEDYIKQKLFDFFRGTISRGTVKGLAEWYKKQLLDSAFTKEAQNV